MSLDQRVIGLLEDDPIMGESLVQRLALEGTVVRWWTSGREAIAEIAREKPEAIVCDIRLPDMSGEQVFREVAGHDSAPPFLFITGFADIDQAVRLMRAGAGDYLAKPFEMPVFLDRLTGLLPVAANAASVLGVSEAMHVVERLLLRVARVRSTVLLAGETGVGKEVCARFLHEAEGARGPFMAVNCAAIPADLLEAELFGHERGAFTGAQGRHLGYAERAGDGTLFLDEIADMALPLQAKVLRVLEERQFFRVGGEAPIDCRARIVCATNKDLEKAVGSGQFREDLFYRVNVLSVTVPPLRQRPEDVIWLLDRFFEEFDGQFQTDLAGVSGLAEDAALGHSWPGNVRELRNRVERAVTLALGPWLMPGDLFPETAGGAAPAELPSLEEARTATERRHIQRALNLTGNEIGQAAKLLGVSRTTLWEKMRRLGLSSDTA